MYHSIVNWYPWMKLISKRNVSYRLLNDPDLAILSLSVLFDSAQILFYSDKECGNCLLFIEMLRIFLLCYKAIGIIFTSKVETLFLTTCNISNKPSTYKGFYFEKLLFTIIWACYIHLASTWYI